MLATFASGRCSQIAYMYLSFCNWLIFSIHVRKIVSLVLFLLRVLFPVENLSSLYLRWSTCPWPHGNLGLLREGTLACWGGMVCLISHFLVHFIRHQDHSAINAFNTIFDLLYFPSPFFGTKTYPRPKVDIFMASATMASYKAASTCRVAKSAVEDAWLLNGSPVNDSILWKRM